MVSVALLVLTAVLIINTSLSSAADDTLYVGDVSDNSIKSFDAGSGVFQGAAVKPSLAGLKGPRGILFINPEDNLLVSDQNVNTSAPGDIIQYSVATVNFNFVVNNTLKDAPSQPRGIILSPSRDVFYVADFIAESNKNKPLTPGRVRVYTTAGGLVKDLTPEPKFPNAQFHPRGVVIGPDGLLYVSNFPDLSTGLGGQVLRFNPSTGDIIDVFINDPGGVGQLNRPEGLVFGPDGNLYITSFRADATDTDKIRVYDPTGMPLNNNDIDLDTAGQGQPRAFAQALFFGPGGRLFVPISGGGPDTGSVRSYDVGDKTKVDFVSAGGPLGAGWYLTFGKTNPSTFAYGP
jgi:sugar lactone lactonase YvrE